MTRLVVEEGGKRRAFKVGDGVITIGSGGAASLKLASTGVAEVHAEIVVHEGVVKLRPRPGVTPPKLGGKPQSAEFVVPRGVPVQIGEAKLTVDPPEPASAPKPAAPAERKQWERTSRELYRDRGLKPQHVLLILVPIAVVLFFLFRKFWNQAPAPALAAAAQVNRAKTNVRAGMWDQARADLDAIPAKDELSPEIQAQIADLRAQIEAGRVDEVRIKEEMKGSEYLTSQLENYERDRLQGKVDKPAVRVFLKRLAEFERRWPSHPRMDWVRRMKERYGDMVDLSKPPTYEELEFEVKSLTWANPRDYVEALEVLDKWLEKAGGEERAKGLALLDKTLEERQAWFTDRMFEARHQFEKGQIAQAVQWLTILIVFTGDQAMAKAAAEELVKFDLLDQHLRGQRSTYPDRWPTLSSNPVIAAWLREHPLDPPEAKRAAGGN
jgi:hypothetical protein